MLGRAAERFFLSKSRALWAIFEWIVIGLSLDCHWIVIGLSLDCLFFKSLDCHSMYEMANQRGMFMVFMGIFIPVMIPWGLSVVKKLVLYVGNGSWIGLLMVTISFTCDPIMIGWNMIMNFPSIHHMIILKFSMDWAMIETISLVMNLLFALMTMTVAMDWIGSFPHSLRETHQ